MVICSTPSRIIEEILAVETEVVLDKAIMIGGIKGVTPTSGKRTGTGPESLAEGGVITPDRAIAETQSSAGTAENPATTKKSTGRRNVRQADN